MYTSLMSLFGSITDQSQEYIGFLNINFIMGPWLYYDASGLTDQLIVQL